jgi:hypothetical protein
MNQNWLNDARLEQISWDKRTFLVNWLKDNAYKKKEDLLPAMLSLTSTMNAKHLSLTPDEQRILSAVIQDAMSPAERQQYQMIQNLLQKK